MLEYIKSIFIPQTYTLSNGKTIKSKFNWTPYITIGVIFLLYLCASFTGFSMETLIKNGSKFTTILVRMVTDFNTNYFAKVWAPMVDTLTMSLLGTLVGCIVALPIAFLSSNNINNNKTVVWTLRAILSVVRTIPVLIYALILTYIFDIGPFAGFLAICIFTFSIASKMIYEQIETCDMGPFEALESTGASRVKCAWTSIFPQIKAYFISNLLYNFEMNVRSAAILGYVGAGGIGLLMNDRIGNRKYGDLGVILFVLIITVVCIESASRYFRKKLS